MYSCRDYTVRYENCVLFPCRLLATISTGFTVQLHLPYIGFFLELYTHSTSAIFLCYIYTFVGPQFFSVGVRTQQCNSSIKYIVSCSVASNLSPTAMKRKPAHSYKFTVKANKELVNCLVQLFYKVHQINTPLYCQCLAACQSE